MKIKWLAFSILTLFLFSASTAFSAGLCSKLFETTPKISTNPRDYISKEKLAAEGLELTTDQFGRILLVRDDGKILGEIAVKIVSLLYQWGPLDYQKSYLANNGIDKDLLQEMIQDPPQKFGKGFYVSTNPYDSSYFGDGVTAFKVASPIVTIKQDNGPNQSEKVKDFSTETIQKLQSLNIDAIQTLQDSWLSVIDHKHLVTARKISEVDPSWSETYVKYQTLLLANFKASGVQKWLPKNHIIQRILTKKLTSADIILLKSIKPFIHEFSSTNGTTVRIPYDYILNIPNASVSLEAYKESLNLLNQALAVAGVAPLAL
ncbi:MAG: hypothetical protein H7Z71_10205 [Moraxellaceae bacterium]|nr:hypothetical protein [Pseudobdellovibrionaceae bacterium]